MMGLTVACARCHDHKFDPIPSRDYYSLYGVFASSMEPEQEPLLGIEAPAKAREEYLAEHKKRVEERDKFREEKERRWPPNCAASLAITSWRLTRRNAPPTSRTRTPWPTPQIGSGCVAPVDGRPGRLAQESAGHFRAVVRLCRIGGE
jgi:hypothetical protein